MTYRSLENWISRLSESQKDYDVSVFLNETEEYLPLVGMFIENHDDVLDTDHPVLEVGS